MADEKKDNPDNEKGDKGHERERKEEALQEHTPGQKGGPERGAGHRRRTGGNPDGSN